MKLVIGAITFVILFVACSKPSRPEDPLVIETFTLNQDGQAVHLQSLPIIFDYAQNVPEEFLPYFDQAAKDLNKNLGIEAIRLSGKRVSADFMKKEPDQRNVILWVDKFVADTVMSDSEQAKATIFWAGTEIYESDIRFNAFKTNDFKDLDMNTLIRHELAHALGFTHKHVESDLMNTQLADHTVKGPLDINSIAAFRKVYRLKLQALASVAQK